MPEGHWALFEPGKHLVCYTLLCLGHIFELKSLLACIEKERSIFQNITCLCSFIKNNTSVCPDKAVTETKHVHRETSVQVVVLQGSQSQDIRMIKLQLVHLVRPQDAPRVARSIFTLNMAHF